MKILKCPKCNRTQSAGKFCLDDGTLLKEIITTTVKFNAIETTRPSDTLKKDIRNWLSRLGVQQTEIKIANNDNEAIIEYLLNKKLYKFSSHLQKGFTNNLAAVEMFLHHRVLGIERGIETTEQAFAGYEALPDFTGNEDPYTILGLDKSCTLEEASKKFKEFAKKYHPDVNKSPGAELQFNRIRQAFDTIERDKL